MIVLSQKTKEQWKAKSKGVELKKKKKRKSVFTLDEMSQATLLFLTSTV